MDSDSKSTNDIREYPTPRSGSEGISAHIIGSSRTAIPPRFRCEAGVTALRRSMPVNIHVLKGDIHCLTKTVISAGVEGRLFNHHKMHVMTGAGACVIHVRNFHALPNIHAPDFNIRRDAVFSDVQVDLIGPGAGAAVLKRDAVRTA